MISKLFVPFKSVLVFSLPFFALLGGSLQLASADEYEYTNGYTIEENEFHGANNDDAASPKLTIRCHNSMRVSYPSNPDTFAEKIVDVTITGGGENNGIAQPYVLAIKSYSTDTTYNHQTPSKPAEKTFTIQVTVDFKKQTINTKNSNGYELSAAIGSIEYKGSGDPSSDYVKFSIKQKGNPAIIFEGTELVCSTLQ